MKALLIIALSILSTLAIVMEPQRVIISGDGIEPIRLASPATPITITIPSTTTTFVTSSGTTGWSGTTSGLVCTTPILRDATGVTGTTCAGTWR